MKGRIAADMHTHIFIVYIHRRHVVDGAEVQKYSPVGLFRTETFAIIAARNEIGIPDTRQPALGTIRYPDRLPRLAVETERKPVVQQNGITAPLQWIWVVQNISHRVFLQKSVCAPISVISLYHDSGRLSIAAAAQKMTVCMTITCKK